jgi:peptide/nickel transport system permease protein
MAGVIIIVFIIFSFLPADPAVNLAGQRTDATTAQIINRDFALDQPSYIRFAIYINDLLPLSIYNRKEKESPIYLDPAKYRKAFKMFYFGKNKAIVFKSPYMRRSFQSKDSVYDMLTSHFRESLVLVTAAIVIAFFFGVFLGIYSALRKNTFISKVISFFSLAGISLPVFFVAIVFAWLFGFVLHRFTGLNMTGGLYSIDPFEGEYINWKNLLLPAFVLSLQPMAVIIRQSHRLFLEVMSQQHIVTAKAKGVRKLMLLFNHAWLNTTAPLLILSNKWLGSLLGSLLFTEFVFNWNGIGKLAVSAIINSDLPVMMGLLIFIPVIYILLYTFAKLLYSTLDPRIDLKMR